ncbi:MAG: formate dehydrogenase accessory sulfurtransferase FdhD [Sphingomonas sp.]
MPRPFDRIARDRSIEPVERAIACEMPVAIECNGLGYAVLMATPEDLIDLAYGFALTERLIDGAADIADAEVHEVAGGSLVRLTLDRRVSDRIADRVRHRATDSSCGLCGIESIEQALRPLPELRERWRGSDTAVFRALDALGERQPLNIATRAVHAATACSIEGDIRLVREDVGRHNAFDKLIGAMLRDRLDWGGGFALLSSRCSFELVEKAVLSGCPMLATISAPTHLALERARAAGLALRTLARSDALLRPAE